MTESSPVFAYVAIDATGKRVQGVIAAGDEGAAFNELKRGALSPVSIRIAKARTRGNAHTRLDRRTIAELLHDLALLLQAGADMKTALSIIAQRSPRPTISAISRNLNADIGGGMAIETAFARAVGSSNGFVSGLVAAGEASGDLAGALLRGAQLIEVELALRRKVVSAITYPAFIACMMLSAVLIILLAVVPALAPLLEGGNAEPPLVMRGLIALSALLRDHGVLLMAALIVAILGLVLGWRGGLLASSVDRFLLDGPAQRTMRGLVFGSFAVRLGELLKANVPAPEAIRVCAKASQSLLAARRIESVGQAVRLGERLSTALEQTQVVPPSIAHLARLGEEAGALGSMLERSGRLEQEAALKRIEAVSQWLGPCLIVLLGVLIGALMAGLLSGVTTLGEAALG